jgi:hypothetical protein
MTAGNQPTQAQINATVGGFAIQLRSLFQGVQNFEAWLTAAGGATFLEAAPLSYSTADAATIVSTIGNLNTLAGIYSGIAQTGGAFNYEANSNVLWGGQ